jgi:hypothetical protein
MFVRLNRRKAEDVEGDKRKPEDAERAKDPVATVQEPKPVVEHKKEWEDRAGTITVLICSWIFAAIIGFIAACLLIRYYSP